MNEPVTWLTLPGERVSEAIAKNSIANDVTSDNETPPTRESETDSSAARVAINTATLGQLTTLPGIGEALAQRILDYRKAHEPFEDMHEMTAVSGLGSGLLEKLEGLIVFD